MSVHDATDKLLTIAIPTYNRAAYLDACLRHICSQLGDGGGDVEVLVSDNDSTDDTAEVVKRYISEGCSIDYVKTEKNIGPDDNFSRCFVLARGKYVLLLGDDDILLDGAIGRLSGILRSGDYGVVHLNSYGFINDYLAEMPGAKPSGCEVYGDRREFVKRAHYFLTFISVNVINRAFLKRGLDIGRFKNTNLVQMGWTFPALFDAESNLYVRDYMVAAKIYNSGGYRLCEVFGENFNKIFDTLKGEGADGKLFDIIIRNLLGKFFPANIVRARVNLIGTGGEDYFKVLYPLYGRYAYFWLFTVPAIYLPKRLAFFLYQKVAGLRKNFSGTRSSIESSEKKASK